MPAPRFTDATARILAMVESVPEGCVATYGQVAQEAGLPGRARLVGRVLSQLPDTSTLPWHRIVNASGQVSLRGGSGQSLQRARLQREGVEFRASGRIDLARFGWDPTW